MIVCKKVFSPQSAAADQWANGKKRNIKNGNVTLLANRTLIKGAVYF
ncbi:MAG: hypothetical protein WAU11_16225 [Ignavibacteriaceae bacterium]